MNPKKENKTVFLICVLVECLLLAVLVLGCIFLKNLREEQQSAQAPTVPTQATTGQPTPATAPETVPQTTTAPPAVTVPSSQPEALSTCLQQGGINYATLETMGCTQLVVVSAKGTWAQIRFFQCASGVWEENTALICEGSVGNGGVSHNKQEGDEATPAGLHPVTEAFYIHQQPPTGLNAFQITTDTYWVDDPNSVFYNQRVESTAGKDWDSAEHMIDYPQYRYGFVVGYNMPARPAAGSAIFFHIGETATAGCIATNEAMVLAYLNKLDKTCNPHILILN